MYIKKVEIKGLYGIIDKTIKFKEDFTLLVGINGSGKTSILNLINWILKPSFDDLRSTEFDYVKIFFHFNNLHYIIKCSHSDDNLIYSVSEENRTDSKYKPIVIKNINSFDRDMRYGRSFGRKNHKLNAKYYKNEFEKNTYDFISSLPTPNVIGLDRTLYFEDRNNAYIEKGYDNDLFKREHISSLTPLKKIKELINDEYIKNKNEILVLTNSLKQYLTFFAFDGNINGNIFKASIVDKNINKLNLKKIEKLEKKLEHHFIQFETIGANSEGMKNINTYFSGLKEIIKKYDNLDIDEPRDDDTEVRILYLVNLNQFERIEKLLQKFNDFEAKLAKISYKLDNYLEVLNLFFKDSNKQLKFKKDSSDLIYNTIDFNGSITSLDNNVNNLASGEQQILILFSYLAFNLDKEKIFIIDEPEISLHVKWQEDFLGAIKKITGGNIQIIIATHSPIIVGKMKDNAVVLMPYNN